MQPQLLAAIAFSCVLAASVVAQTSNPVAPVPRLHPREKEASLAAAHPDTTAPKGNPDAVAMDQAVITLKGSCTPVGDLTPAKDCVSEVIKAQFQKLTTALQPGMNWDMKRGFATNYGKLLGYADAARGLNLESDPDVVQVIQFVTNQAEVVKRHYSDQYAHPSAQQIEGYYKHNSAAGVTGAGSPDVSLGARQPGGLPVNQEAVFRIKTSEISQVFSDPAGHYIYNAVSVREILVSEVRAISKTLQQRQMQDKLDEIGKTATPVLNEVYFGLAPVSGGPMPGGRSGPAGAPQASNPPK